MNAILKNLFRLEQTCSACPEQYDVFLRATDEEVGYMRLRYGYFRVECPCGGEVVYHAYPRGDGAFECNEREMYLENGLQAIKDYLEDKENQKAIDEFFEDVEELDVPHSEDPIGL